MPGGSVQYRAEAVDGAFLGAVRVSLGVVELDHAQETLSELLELLIEHTRPPLILSRLAGDAVISYALRGSRRMLK